MVLKLHFLYENMSPSLSNEYSSVHENIAVHKHITWLMRVSPVSLPLSLVLRILHLIPPVLSRWEHAHTKMPLRLSVCQLYQCCAAKPWHCCWNCVETHGASKQEFTVWGQVREQPFPLQGKERESERAWKRLWDWKNQFFLFIAADWTDVAGLERVFHEYLHATRQSR